MLSSVFHVGTCNVNKFVDLHGVCMKLAKVTDKGESSCTPLQSQKT